ncbi:hypothetical protein Hdeb2414_s0086g00784421 [Helianthus debilis subsp. tardiflorus]
MKKGIVDVNLPNRPPTRESNRKNNPNSGRFDHWTKCLSIVNTLSLVKTLCYKPCLVATHRTIRISFNPVDPLATNNVGTSGSRNQTPRLVGIQGIHLNTHRIPPNRPLLSLTKRTRLCGGSSSGMKHHMIRKLSRLASMVTRTSNHRMHNRRGRRRRRRGRRRRGGRWRRRR